MAAQHQWRLQIPATGDYWDPLYLSVYWIVKHFQEWELPLTAGPERKEIQRAAWEGDVILAQDDADRFAQANAVVEAQMRVLVRGILPEGVLHDASGEGAAGPRDEL